MPDDGRLEALEERLTAVEAQLQIRDALACYGFAADRGDAVSVAELFSPDAVVTVDGGRRVLRGRDGIRELVIGSEPRSILPGASHSIGPIVVRVDRDEAIAFGYSRVDYTEDYRVSPISISASLWRLSRRDGVWVIVEHETHDLGSAEAQMLLQHGLPDMA